MRSHDYRAAEESLSQAVVSAESARAQIVLIDALGTIGALHIRLGRYDQAEQASRKALGLIENSGNRKTKPMKYGEALVSGNLGSIAAWRGEDREALRHFVRAIELFSELNQSDGAYETAILDNQSAIGRIYYNLGDYRQALNQFSGVLREAEKDGYREVETAVLNDMGLLYMDQADFNTAANLFSKSLQIAQETENRTAKTIAACNLGVVNERQGNLGQAESHFRDCLKSAEQVPSQNLMIPALEGLATVAKDRNQNKIAFENYEKALEIALNLGDKMRQSELLWWKACLFHDQGDYRKSLELSAEAERLAVEIHEVNYSYLALTSSGKSYLALGQYEAAKTNLARAIEKVEQIRSRVGGQAQQRAFFFERKIEPYYLMVDLLVRQNRPGEALEFAESARSRTLLDLAGSVKPDLADQMTPVEKEQERRLSRELAALNTQLYREYQKREPDKSRGRELTVRMEKARVDYEGFMDRLYATRAEMLRGAMQPAAFTLRDADSIASSPDAAIIEFEILDDKAFAFVLAAGDGGQIQVHAYSISISRKDLAGRVHLFRDRIANNSLGIDKLASDLHQLLLGPIAKEIKGKKTLILVPDDVLWELPFQALKAVGGHYVIEDHVVSYAPSLTALREMKKRENASRPASADPSPAAKSERLLLAFGDPAFSNSTADRSIGLNRDERLGSLPAAKKEVEALAGLYGASKSRVFIGSVATEENAKTEMERFKILHFATHGILDGANPLYSHIVLSQPTADSTEDGLLEAREIMSMNLKADLAVLSACQTGRGRISRGEGVIGLSWALFVAGCPTSVVSQWSVESNSTAKLMVEFHRALLAINQDSAHIHGAAEALREAVLKLLKTPNYSHPLCWAGFIVLGDGR